MYIADHIDIQYAFNTKINKIKNKQHMVLKEEEGVRREEDFIPSETEYKKILLYMLNKKFESLYYNRVKQEEKEQTRIRKQKDREEKKKKSGAKQSKHMSKHDPRFDEQKQLIKTFKSLVSKDGVVADNAVNKHDLIIEANKKPLSILIIGKPRSGKTRVSQDLSKSLDLVHV
jgi:type IV secretory pathway ATPase VirB11/archaellum biosynthesis ATPase